VRPSIQPSSPRRRTRAATQLLRAAAEPALKKPMVGSFAGCCARAASGHAAAPPRSVMNVRRFMLRSFCDHVSDGRPSPAHLQDASNRQANDDESADEHTDCGQSTFLGEIGFFHSGTEPSRWSSGSLLHTSLRHSPGNQRKFTHYQGYHRQRLAFFWPAFCTPTSCPQGCRHVLHPRRSSEVLAADPSARLS